jgi:hypothetical protein
MASLLELQPDKESAIPNTCDMQVEGCGRGGKGCGWGGRRESSLKYSGEEGEVKWGCGRRGRDRTKTQNRGHNLFSPVSNLSPTFKISITSSAFF